MKKSLALIVCVLFGFDLSEQVASISSVWVPDLGNGSYNIKTQGNL